MGSVALTTAFLRMPGIGPDGELVLDAGGGRLPTPEERRLLRVGPGHAERPRTVLPYRYKDAYGRDVREIEQRVAVLDNGRLRATFLLDQGGRLASLLDLGAGRELLHQPDSVQLANLALRNAWFAGGVEWNLGVTGHWGLTCDPVCAGTVDGEVLRMWAHERLLGLTWRLDAWLPEGSDVLYTHAVIDNPTDGDVPVYWWSNIAVPQDQDTRVLVDADRALHFGYTSTLSDVPIPFREGADISWPQRHDGSADYFYNTSGSHPWIAAVDADGYGLGEASTSRLAGRKLFTWGSGSGGRTWQRWLSGSTSYTEIQAGLTRTQLEHLRLGPGQSWRFTESFRPIHVGEADGEWIAAVTAARRSTVDPERLDRAHAYLTAVEDRPVDDDTSGLRGGVEAQGWGALEVAAGHRRPDPATPFAPELLDDEQRAWLSLARAGRIDPLLQRSAMVGPDWHGLLEAAEPWWLRDLLLGHAEHAAGNTPRARELWSRSAAAHETADAWRALGLTAATPTARTRDLVRAHDVDQNRVGIAIEALTALLDTDEFDDALALIENLPENGRHHPRVAYLECRAHIRAGDAERAAALLFRPLVLPDLREGDVGLDQLWDAYQRLAGTDEPLPAHYDFRMAPSAGAPGDHGFHTAPGTAPEAATTTRDALDPADK